MEKDDNYSPKERAAMLEEEWCLVRDSGELPETAYHAALHYLSAAANGPGLHLSGEQRSYLLEAAVMRFTEIILRDLDFSTRNARISRGLGRAIVNYRRFSVFCGRQGLDAGQVRQQARMALEKFFDAALVERGVAVNCTAAELSQFAVELGARRPETVEGALLFADTAS